MHFKFSFYVKVYPLCCLFFVFSCLSCTSSLLKFSFHVYFDQFTVCLFYFLSVLYPLAFEIVFLCLPVFFSLFLFCNFSLSFLNASAFIIFLLCLCHPTPTFKCFSCLSLTPLLFKFSFCQLLSSFLSPF